MRSAMNKNHLVAIAVGALILSTSNLAAAQADSHNQGNNSHSKHEKTNPIKLNKGSDALKFDTSTATAQGDHSENSKDQKGQHGDQGEHGKHDDQGNHDDPVSGTSPASPLSTRNN